jgi:hypothetical protein
MQGAANACSEKPIEGADTSIGAEFASSNPVFVGIPTKVEEKNFELSYAFDVIANLKGAPDSEVTIHSNPSAACGYEFKLNERYLVFAYVRPGSDSPFAGLTSHTQPLSRAFPELVQLGRLDLAVRYFTIPIPFAIGTLAVAVLWLIKRKAKSGGG